MPRARQALRREIYPLEQGVAALYLSLADAAMHAHKCALQRITARHGVKEPRGSTQPRVRDGKRKYLSPR
jgi:hypothetical protein